ncbi:LacI family DNA-binding transcriptional regulator [Clostridium sp. cel8]|jgi:LacI family transcriptional regulator|uniref:LacI family DNA-binding transcriptional regulator n=1 Tax=unclassified Clostridium TaxID=2614128 RepID=UPI0015F43C03|nr:LacI family DNA-binding transcriptional regulator [Clostridium sp. cel8]MBA5849985.1 LacI family DNA-binding transcriptional regulator [Clostridium sp. cel8]
MANLTIKDISKMAGVGVSTVSRVLNNHPDVKDETRQKVLNVMNKVNYVPNNSARNLKRNTSNNIGVLIKGIHNPFFSKMIKIIEERVAEKEYSMILHYNDKNPNDFETAVEFIKEKRLKGLICLGGYFNNLSKKQLKDLNTPIVFTSIDSIKNIDNELFSSVTIENEKAAFDAVNYICSLGHKNIGVITSGEKGTSVGRLRLEGYKRALRENNIEYNEAFSEKGEYTFEAGFNAANKLLDKNLNITAIFASSDIMAIGASKAILKRGLRIPEDISIIGFDDIEYAKYFHPSITTIRQPVEDMGEKSVDILFNIIKGKSGNKHIVINTELIKRDSCKRLI